MMVSGQDHVTPMTGLSVAPLLSIDGAQFKAAANVVTEVGHGIYNLALTAAETAGECTVLHATAPGADPTTVTMRGYFDLHGFCADILSGKKAINEEMWQEVPPRYRHEVVKAICRGQRP